MRTSAELFASLQPGERAELAGETISACDVDEVPAGVTIADANFVGQMHLYDAHDIAFELCDFTSDPLVELHSQCKFLGGSGWRVSGCTFHGGQVASQLGVGLNTRQQGKAAMPTGWLVEQCAFGPIEAQWGTYPQGHSVYVLASPRWEMGGRIDGCSMRSGQVGAPLKLGGTGNYWRSEGVRGVQVTGCDITGELDEAGRVLAVLTQGARTDVELQGCTLIGEGGAPWVQAMDGAHCRLTDSVLPQGMHSFARWYLGPFGLRSRESTEAHAGPLLRHAGIVWA